MNKGKRGSIPAVFLEMLQAAVYRSMARRYIFHVSDIVLYRNAIHGKRATQTDEQHFFFRFCRTVKAQNLQVISFRAKGRKSHTEATNKASAGSGFYPEYGRFCGLFCSFLNHENLGLVLTPIPLSLHSSSSKSLGNF